VREVDVRVVAATNRNLVQAVADGAFREDLFYRLNVIQIELPPLRERGDDVVLLARHFFEKVRTTKTKVRDFSPEAIAALRAHSWPGNIRELENFVLRLALLCGNELATQDDVTPLLAGGLPSKAATVAASATDHGAPADDANDAGVPVVRPLEEIERRAILAALQQNSGNRTAAAQALGISVRKLQYKIKEYQEAGLADQ
jgi:two-component system NtrC family response regulator/two-component system response regulator HydG